MVFLALSSCGRLTFSTPVLTPHLPPQREIRKRWYLHSFFSSLLFCWQAQSQLLRSSWSSLVQQTPPRSNAHRLLRPQLRRPSMLLEQLRHPLRELREGLGLPVGNKEAAQSCLNLPREHSKATQLCSLSDLKLHPVPLLVRVIPLFQTRRLLRTTNSLTRPTRLAMRPSRGQDTAMFSTLRTGELLL